MKLREFLLLTDECIQTGVVQWLRQAGFDVKDVCEEKLQGYSDRQILRQAFMEDRVVVTHDSDFGTLAILQGEPIVGILYLRPGHIDPQFTIGTIESVLRIDPDLTPPFILVARKSAARVTIRVRDLNA